MKKVCLLFLVISASLSARTQVGFSFGVNAPYYTYSPYYGPAYSPGYGFGVNIAPAFRPTYVYVNEPQRDRAGKKYWRVINRLNRSVRVTAMNGGQRAVIAPGDSMRIARGATFNVRVDARNKRSKIFTTNRHYIILYTNQFGEIDYQH